mgnify:CR=1 FL=1
MTEAPTKALLLQFSEISAARYKVGQAAQQLPSPLRRGCMRVLVAHLRARRPFHSRVYICGPRSRRLGLSRNAEKPDGNGWATLVWDLVLLFAITVTYFGSEA